MAAASTVSVARQQKKKRKTPIPPKPYKDENIVKKHMYDPAFVDFSDLSQTNPETPHWHSGEFESRESVPLVDIWGFNRDWSWSLYKLMCCSVVFLLMYEYRLIRNAPLEGLQNPSPGVTARPSWAREEEDERATEEELRAAGFAYVGTRQLDSIGVVLDRSRQH